MKSVSKSLLIFGLLSSLTLITIGALCLKQNWGPYVLFTGFYGLIMSIASLVVVFVCPKGLINACAVFYVPYFFPASIAMFCIKKGDCRS